MTMSGNLQVHCPSLWNTDLLSMPKHPLVDKTYFFKGLEIKEVCVFGIITSIERMKRAITYHVDDGTGVILCACNESSGEFIHREETVKLLDCYRDPENSYLFSSIAFPLMLERAIDVYDQNYLLQIGDSVHIVGKISQCTEELRVITVSFICPFRDLKSEILMMELRIRFYQEISNCQKQLKKGKITIENFSRTDYDRKNDSDKDWSSEESFLKVKEEVKYETFYPCIGEWHEEYFMKDVDEYCAETSKNGDCNPD